MNVQMRPILYSNKYGLAVCQTYSPAIVSGKLAVSK